jgi:hypothetical protein
MLATRPLFWFRGGTPPTTPRHGGFAPLDPPFAHPRGLRVRRCSGSHSWRVCKSWQLAPSLKILGAHPPSPLGGGEAPSTPALIRVGEGRPFSKRLTSVGVNGAHPTTPTMGALPPWTPHCPPPWAEGLPGFWVPLVAGFASPRPLPEVKGRTPPKFPLPCEGRWSGG